MTMHDVLEYAEYSLREDKEYWAQMDKMKNDIEKLICQHNKIMAAAIIRLAITMMTEPSGKIVDCTGGYCEEECLTDEE